jgi:CRP/FNR family transcriptional regulator, cyclic AMP receptor protein
MSAMATLRQLSKARGRRAKTALTDVFKIAHISPLMGAYAHDEVWSLCSSEGGFLDSTSALQLRGNSLDADCFASEISVGLAKRDGVLATEILPVFYPPGGMFFMEGQSATGIFLLRSGRAKESMVSNRGKTAIVRVIGPGEMLGLSAILRGEPHESTVETLEATHADFVRKAVFLHALKTSGRIAQMVASQLSRNCTEAYATIRCLGLSGSASEKLARLLLHWAECPLANHNRQAGLRIRVTLTHEEIGQFVGSTRETISRILGEFREQKWLARNGSTWTITNEDAIRRFAGVE